MPDILVRNVPPELHEQLKAAAAVHRRSVTQEAIAIIEEKLAATPTEAPVRLPEAIKPQIPNTMEENLHFIGQGQKNRSQPGWAKDSLRILHPVEGPSIPDSDWNMLNDDLAPLK